MRLSPIQAVMAGTTVLRLVFAATTGLGIDESYMVTAGRVLSLGYFDHPPASWWLSWGAAHLLGTEAPWAVRLPFIALFALSQSLLWRISRLVADDRAAYWAVVAFNLSPVFGVTTGTWVLPDGPLDAALLGAAFFMLRALAAPEPASRGWWVATGLCAGLALFSKYSAVLTIAGAFLFLASSPSQRFWLRRREPYIAAVVALVVFSPVLIWNAAHGWASFAFQAARAEGLRFQPLKPLETLSGEAIFVLPWFWAPMMMLFVAGFHRDAAAPKRLLVCLAAPPIVIFALVSAWSSQRILYHWAAPGYLMLFPLLGEAISKRADRAWLPRLMTASAILTGLLLIVVVTQLQFDWLGNRLTAITRTDPTAEGIDWTTIRQDLAGRGLLPPGTVAASLNWRDAGKIGYALGPDVPMLCLNTDSRQFGFGRSLEDFARHDVLLLMVDPPGQYGQWFQTLEVLPATSVRLDGRVLKTITVLRGRIVRGISD